MNILIHYLYIKEINIYTFYPQVRSGSPPKPTEENINFINDIYGYLVIQGYIRGFSVNSHPWKSNTWR